MIYAAGWGCMFCQTSFGEVLDYINNNDPKYFKVLNSKDLGESDEKTH